MKKCSDCNVEMIEDTNIHTDYVGGVSFEEQIYLSFAYGTHTSKNIFGKEKERANQYTKRVKARLCPQCGKIELYVDVNSSE